MKKLLTDDHLAADIITCAVKMGFDGCTAHGTMLNFDDLFDLKVCIKAINDHRNAYWNNGKTDGFYYGIEDLTEAADFINEKKNYLDYFENGDAFFPAGLSPEQYLEMKNRIIGDMSKNGSN